MAVKNYKAKENNEVSEVLDAIKMSNMKNKNRRITDEEEEKIYNKYFSEVDNTLGEYLWRHVNNNIDDNFMETLWNNQAHLDKFHEIRNKITELLTAIELEDN